MGLEADDLDPATKELIAALTQLAQARDIGKATEADIGHAVAKLGAMPPDFVPMAANQIAFWMRPSGASSWHGGLLSRFFVSDQDVIKMPGGQWLGIFSHDGRVREVSLARLHGPAPTPFFLTALVWRLNDWVPEVRRAAQNCAARVFPATNAATIVQAAPFIMARRWQWSRWTSERALVDGMFDRSDLTAELSIWFLTAKQGPVGRLLREVLRRPSLDPYLEKLAVDAWSPAVRAIVLDCLIEGRARWRSGRQWQGTSKVYNEGRWVAAFATRPIEGDQRPEHWIMVAARDKSAAVRKIAADAMIVRRTSLSELGALIDLLRNDQSRAVRERIDFLLRKAGQP